MFKNSAVCLTKATVALAKHCEVENVAERVFEERLTYIICGVTRR